MVRSTYMVLSSKVARSLDLLLSVDVTFIDGGALIHIESFGADVAIAYHGSLITFGPLIWYGLPSGLPKHLLAGCTDRPVCSAPESHRQIH